MPPSTVNVQRPISGTDLLKAKLPKIDPPSNDYHAIAANTTSTKDIDPPVGLVAITPDDLPNAEEDKRMAKPLETMYVRLATEESHVLNTEGDVERVTHLYLLHEINQILEEYVSICYPSKRLLCNSQSTEGNARTDIVWTIGGVGILVLELKRCNVIRKSDWTKFIIKVDTNIADKEKFVKSRMQAFNASADQDREHTNYFPLTQQAVKYHRSHKAPVVLLFDWVTMILLDFMPNGKEWNNEANPARVFFSTDGRGGAGTKDERQVTFLDAASRTAFALTYEPALEMNPSKIKTAPVDWYESYGSSPTAIASDAMPAFRESSTSQAQPSLKPLQPSTLLLSHRKLYFWVVSSDISSLYLKLSSQLLRAPSSTSMNRAVAPMRASFARASANGSGRPAFNS
ncbi:hypothetical protein B0H12DRAFT_1327575 [Mycena haematopus]|nr:hypothetical protein B0H12DRAFT_1327575 [Mycena haematopus]